MTKRADQRLIAPRLLHPDIYDALELSALVFGGVGRDTFARDDTHTTSSDLRDGAGCPNCIHGHAYFLEGQFGRGEVAWPLVNAEITFLTNDTAVNGDEVIDWEEYCKRTGIVRADVPTFDPVFVASLAGVLLQ